jgi:hypothetical protein
MNDVTRMSTPGYKLLRGEYNIMAGDEDVWGQVMEWWFSIAEILVHWVDETPELPAEWQFHDAAAHGDTWRPDTHVETFLADYWDCGDITTEDLLTFGEVLSRYADLLRA